MNTILTASHMNAKANNGKGSSFHQQCEKAKINERLKQSRLSLRSNESAQTSK